MSLYAEHPDLSSREIVVHAAGQTDVGQSREHNEDAFLIANILGGDRDSRPDGCVHMMRGGGTVLMVADGLGGAAAGEVASALAIQTIVDELERRWTGSPELEPENFADALRGATEVANTRIYEYARAHPESHGLGTTATIATLLHDTLYLAQIGDSRAYLFREGELRQITRDQSLMQRLIDAGEMTEEEAERSERRNIILQALGPEPIVRIDVTYLPLRRGDILLLCTDGLSGQVKRQDMTEVLEHQQDLVTACGEMIDLANESGGPDNITVVLGRFEGRGLLPPSPDDVVERLEFAGNLTAEFGPAPSRSRRTGEVAVVALDPMERAAMTDIRPEPVTRSEPAAEAVASRTRPTLDPVEVTEEHRTSVASGGPMRTAMLWGVLALLLLGGIKLVQVYLWPSSSAEETVIEASPEVDAPASP